MATEDVLNLENNFLAFEITVANSGSHLLLICPIRDNLVLLILNFSKIDMTYCNLCEKHDSLLTLYRPRQ